MSHKRMLIIGAGIAGLSTGCYAQMNGYSSSIFEMHDKPGGLCTSWTRKGYTFDGCVHDLIGVSPASRMYPVWQELGAMPTPVHHCQEFVRVELADGQLYRAYNNIDRAEQYLLQLAPGAKAIIGEYITAARAFTHFEMLAMPLMTPAQTALAILPKAALLAHWGKLTLEDLGQRFQRPLLQQAFPTLQYDFAKVPVLVHLAFLAACHTRQMGWPVGGSLRLARSVEKRYQSLGGDVHYRARVEEILVEGDHAVGVRLTDDSEERGDWVISAADGYSTVFNLLGGKYLNNRLRAYYAAAPQRQEMSLQVSLGVARDLSQEPRAITLFLERPLEVAGEPRPRLDLELFGYDPSMAPAGKGVIKVMLASSHSYWKALREQGAAYAEEKERVAEALIGTLAQRFPGLKEQVEVIDVATPLTTERFTGNYHGLQAWGEPGAGLTSVLSGKPETVPGLGAFYMVGQWASTIGLSTVAINGRKLVGKICHQDGKTFHTNIAGAGSNRCP
jgi:phytoene dehydrogenase-like protein